MTVVQVLKGFETEYKMCIKSSVVFSFYIIASHKKCQYTLQYLMYTMLNIKRDTFYDLQRIYVWLFEGDVIFICSLLSIRPPST